MIRTNYLRINKRGYLILKLKMKEMEVKKVKKTIK